MTNDLLNLLDEGRKHKKQTQTKVQRYTNSKKSFQKCVQLRQNKYDSFNAHSKLKN